MTESDIRDLLATAMRARDKARTSVLRRLLASLKNRAIDQRSGGDAPTEASEKDVLATVQREAKQVRESLDFARKAGREESVAEHEADLAVLEELLPGQLSEEELRAIVTELAAAGGGIGPVMKALGERYAGRYDGKVASAIVREVLAG